MTDTTESPPVPGSEGWYLASAAERRARLTDLGLMRYARLVAAAGINVELLSGRAQLFCVWLCGWDEPTIEGAIELFSTAKQVAALRTMDEAARQASRILDGQTSIDDHLRLAK